MRHYGLFWGEFGADLVGVKYCSHTLLLHAWVSVRRARAHPEAADCASTPGNRSGGEERNRGGTEVASELQASQFEVEHGHRTHPLA